MKLRWLLLVSLGLLLTNCSKDDDSGKDIELATGIPDNSKATPSPEVNPAEFSSSEVSSSEVSSTEANSTEVNSSEADLPEAEPEELKPAAEIISH